MSELVATDEVIRSVLLNAEPEKVDAVFQSADQTAALTIARSYLSTLQHSGRRSEKRYAAE